MTPCRRRAGAKTGRSPRDKRVVRESNSEADIWWAASDNAPANGSPNYEMDEKCAASVNFQLPGVGVHADGSAAADWV